MTADPNPTPGRDDATLMIHALTWVLSDEARASRFLGLTGLSPDRLRAMMGTPALNEAVARFLEGHEADLIACAHALGLEAGVLAAAVQAAQT